MRIGIDAQLGLGTATGIGEYLHGLVPALRRLGTDIKILRSELLDPWRFDRRFLWDQVLLPLSSLNVNLLHCAAGTMPYYGRVPIVVTVHDVAWLRAQAHAPWYARGYFGQFMLEQYERARKIIVVSEFSKRELLECSEAIDPENVTVVHNGVDPAFAQIQRRPDPAKPFILAVGTVERRKNAGVLIRALADMRLRSARLVVPGPPTTYQDECEALATELGVRDRVDFLGYIHRDELLALYATASVAAVPSRYEGFGYAVAQALVAGVPVIAANTTSLPEVLGQGGVLLDPDISENWAHALDEVIEHQHETQARAESLREAATARFHWLTAAVKTNDVYQAALRKT